MKKNMMIVEMRKTALDVVCLLPFFFLKEMQNDSSFRLFFVLDLCLMFFSRLRNAFVCSCFSC
jgi:hypothetical protein